MTPPRWFKGCLTAWAIHVAIYRWRMIEFRQIAISIDNAAFAATR